VFSLLGPNGAGKSTAISIISGLLKPDKGDAFVMGHSVTRESVAARKEIGLVPQDVALYADMSAQENLEFWGRMNGLSGSLLKQRVQEVLAAVGLTERQKGRLSTYSGGMKRRVNIGAALLHKPAVVIMDEPTVGIDPQTRRHILDYVKELSRQGTTVLYTTHYMEEAEELSHRIAVMDSGKVIACGTRDELVRLVGEQARVELVATGDLARLQSAWQAVAGVTRVSIEAGKAETADDRSQKSEGRVQKAEVREDGGTDSRSQKSEGRSQKSEVGGQKAEGGSEERHGSEGERGKIIVLVKDPDSVVPRLFEAASRSGCRISFVDIHEPNLEAVFLHLTGKALRD
jgi:ABC-2 type transport system ATP-binding protein